MAFQLPSYTDTRGVTYTDSYWYLAGVNISAEDNQAVATFYGYRDKAARQEPGITNIGTKSYILEGEAFDALKAQLLAADNNLWYLAYVTAAVTQDVPTGEVDENGNPVMVGFFDGAVQV